MPRADALVFTASRALKSVRSIIGDAFPDRAATNLLSDVHGDHEQDAEAGREAELPADAQVADLTEAKHGNSSP